MRNKVLIFMVTAIALFCLTGQAMAEFELSPWKNKSGTLGSEGRVWRYATAETAQLDYATVEKAFKSTTAAEFTGAFTATDLISAEDIDDPVRSFTIPLSEFTIVGASGPLAAADRGTSTPGFTEQNGLPAICYGSPQIGSTSSHLIAGFAIPDAYYSSLGFRVWASQDNWQEASPNTIDWSIWVNTDAEVFDAASTPQTGVALASGSQGSPTSTPDIIALVVDGTGLGQLGAAKQCYLEIWAEYPAGQAGNTRLYIYGGIEIYYTATQ